MTIPGRTKTLLFSSLVFSIAWGATGCSLKARQGHAIRIALPQASAKASRLATAPNQFLLTSEQSVLNDSDRPLSLDDINCYALNVTGDGITPDSRMAHESACAPSEYFGILAGMVPVKDGYIEVMVPPGTKRNFQLWGLKSKDGTCPAVADLLESHKKFEGSNPYELGRATADVVNDDTVQIKLKFDPANLVPAFCTDPKVSPSSTPAAPGGVNAGGNPVLNFPSTPIWSVGAAMNFAPTSLSAGNGSSIVSCGIKPGSPNDSLFGTLGLSIDPITCAIQGTPTSTLSATQFTIAATNDLGQTSADSIITLTLTPGVPQLVYAPNNPVATVGTAITITPSTLVSNGGTLSGCSVSSGTLPGGLTLNPTTCEITGTPGAGGTASLQIVVSNGTNASPPATLNLTVNAALSAVIGDVNLSSGGTATFAAAMQIGDSVGITFSGGVAPYTITLSPSYGTASFAGNVLTYAATASGSESFEVSDSSTPAQQYSFGINVSNALTASVTHSKLFAGNQTAIASSGGVGAVTYSVVGLGSIAGSSYNAPATLPPTLPATKVRAQDNMGHVFEVPITLVYPKDIQTGPSHGCALISDGTVQCWGSNSVGQLGGGAAANSIPAGSAIAVSGLTNATAIAVGGSSSLSHSCAIANGGYVYCWGSGISGQLGQGTTSDFNIPVKVKGVGGTSYLSGITSIVAGAAHVCALNATSGSVYCWGSNTQGQLGDSTTTDRQSPMQVKGVNNIGFLPNIEAIASGANHVCAMDQTYTMACWGSNSSGQIGDNSSGVDRMTPVPVSGLSGLVSIAAGGSHSCAIDYAGVLRCWGANNNAQIGTGSSGANVLTPTAVVGLSNVSQVAIGGQHTCAVDTGALKCWGWGDWGQIGDGVTPVVSTVTNPTSVALSGTYIGLSAFDRRSCVLLDDGTARCWGDGANYSLGNGQSSTSVGPSLVSVLFAH